MESVRKQVEEDLQAGGISPWEIAAIALASLALVIIAGLVAATYVQARYGRKPEEGKVHFHKTKTDSQAQVDTPHQAATET